MKVNIVNSDYSDMENIIDVPSEYLESKEPLYLGARKGQVLRVRNLNHGCAVAPWELNDYFLLDSNGDLVTSSWKRHTEIFAVDPERVTERYRKVYERLIWKLKTI